jgi:hypothetical protein
MGLYHSQKSVRRKKEMKQKQKNNRTMLGLFAFAMIAILGVSGLVAAHGGFGIGLTDEERTERQAFREQVQEAIANNDFTMWKSLKESMLTEENFDRVAERHQLNSEMRDALQKARETGDYSQVEALKEQYGIEGRGFGRGHSRGFHNNLAQ